MTRARLQIVPREALQVFTHAELELLISGLPDIDVADLKRHTLYGSGLSASARLVQWFWRAVDAMSRQDVAALVQFVTGAPPLLVACFLCLKGMSFVQLRTGAPPLPGVDAVSTASTHADPRLQRRDLIRNNQL